MRCTPARGLDGGHLAAVGAVRLEHRRKLRPGHHRVHSADKRSRRVGHLAGVLGAAKSPLLYPQTLAQDAGPQAIEGCPDKSGFRLQRSVQRRGRYDSVAAAFLGCIQGMVGTLYALSDGLSDAELHHTH